ncbi:MobA/MobL family protein [Sphingobium sp. SJ10-10]|uniref:MobA/MobL family protein n=1 Tax=Sphingobium sp. SJ10-10 TaxID=3114999 RepID=UPI002E19D87B|nr:MobA/MobL family protein [Sphingobium sp. SJ10-10]
MTVHIWTIGGRSADKHALREALALERQSRKKTSVLEYERLQAERNARMVGTAIRRQMREAGLTRTWIQVRPRSLSGHRDGGRRCRRIEIMSGLIVAKRSHRGRDGLSSFHFKWTSRGLGNRRKHGSHRYRRGEAVRHLRYILRDQAREINGGGLVSNISTDPDTLASVFAALEELESHGRTNANVYVSIVLSLPNELTSAEREALLSNICAIFERQSLPHAAVLHAPDPDGDQRNNHAHIMLSLRPFRAEPDGGFAFGVGTAADLNDKEFIKATRLEIATLMNAAMIDACHERRFTALSNQERGLPTRPKNESKSSPGRKHRERRQERVDLMAGEKAYREERINAIGRVQEELIAALVAPQIDRNAELETMRVKVHTSAAVTTVRTTGAISPVARMQPPAAPPVMSDIAPQQVPPVPVPPDLDILLGRLAEMRWPPLERQDGRIVLGLPTRYLHDKAVIDRLRPVQMDERVQAKFEEEWAIAIDALRKRLTQPEPFGRAIETDVSDQALIERAAKAFWACNQRDPDVIALVEAQRSAAERRILELQERERVEKRKREQRGKKVAAAVARICGAAGAGRVSETERAPLRPLVALLEEPLIEGRLALFINNGKLHVQARDPVLIDFTDKLFAMKMGSAALGLLAQETNDLISPIAQPFQTYYALKTFGDDTLQTPLGRAQRGRE